MYIVYNEQGHFFIKRVSMKNYIWLYCLLQLLWCAPLYTTDSITNSDRTDGFGGQYQMMIATATYAELHNMKFLYTPFRGMEHNYYGDPDFLKKKEWLINFIGNFDLNDGSATRPCINFIQFFEQNTTACLQTKVFKKIKRIFRENKTVPTPFMNLNLNIAVHVRRHNPHDSRIEGTDTPDSYYLHIIDRLRQIYKDQMPLFHIYSQGNPINFKVYTAQDVVLHLNETTEESFIQMVYADVLVTTQSSFSYAAGIISEGTVYYIPFWHAPLPHWISANTL